MRKTSLDCVYELAKSDERVVFVGSDLGPGVLDEFKNEFPDRFFMEGIAEQHAVGMAAGLAMEGFVPYVNTIATFLTRRCFEQNVLDLGLHNTNVRLIANGGGVVYAPLGPTHLAIEDIATHWQATGCGMDAEALADALNLEGRNPVARAREVIAALEKHHLVEKSGEKKAKGDGGGQAKKLYKPTYGAIDLYGKANV